MKKAVVSEEDVEIELSAITGLGWPILNSWEKRQNK